MQNSKRKICVVTGTRAEYGLLYWLLKEIQKDKTLKLQLIVTGMHLSPEFGLTYKEVEKEFKITKKIKLALKDDSCIGISNDMAKLQQKFTKTLKDLTPDILVILGDRWEMLSVSISAMLCNIPIAHIHGGETTQGAIDEAIRHSITKMAHLHFTATNKYKKRVIQLGENPKRVFNVGGMGVENIKRLKLLRKSELEKSINFKFNKKNLIVTFHPVTLETKTAKEQFKNLLEVIDDLKETHIIFTKANSDTDGKIINKMIDEYVAKNSHKSVAFTSLGQLRYLSALQYVDAVIGNSSSGLLEAPSFKIATINIGNRQKGRIKAKSVIDCKPTKKDILKAIDKIYKKKFDIKLQNSKNLYEQKKYPSKKIVEILKEIDLDNILTKKFYDITTTKDNYE